MARRRSLTSETSTRLRKSYLLKSLCGLVWIMLLAFFSVVAVDWNAHVYVRSWLAPLADKTPPPLLESTMHCFSDGAYSPVKNGLVPSVSLQADYGCFNFANLIRHPASHNSTSSTPSLFHTRWSNPKGGNSGDYPLAMLRSFAATQDAHAQLWLWVDSSDAEALLASPQWQQAHRHLGDRLKHVIIDNGALTEDTPLSSATDHLNLLVLYKHGGLWFDTDTVFVRDMAPLLVEDWIASQSCATVLANEPSVALLHFEKKSPLLCELLATAAVHDPPTSLFMHAYRQIWYRGHQAWTILPWCYTDPTLCRRSHFLPEAIAQTALSAKRLDQVFTFRLNNARTDRAPFLHLLNKHKTLLGW